MPINGLALAKFISVDSTGQQAVNTFHIVDETQSSPPDLSHLQGLANDLWSDFHTPYQALLTPGQTLTTCQVSQVRDPTVAPPEPLLEAQAVGNIVGIRTVTGNPSPRPVCALLQFRTPVTSRSFRGHMFLPPALSQASYNGDLFAGGSEAYWQAALTLQALFTNGTATGGTRWGGTTLANYFLCVYSRKIELTHGTSVALVTTVTLSNKVRWLRSRARGTT